MHHENQISNQQFHCEECPHRTIVKGYLVDHVRLRNKRDETGMFVCILGKVTDKAQSFSKQHRMEKHKTTHVNVKCNDWEKSFSAKRNLRRHIRKKHPNQDDTLSYMVNRAEIVIQQ